VEPTAKFAVFLRTAAEARIAGFSEPSAFSHAIWKAVGHKVHQHAVLKQRFCADEHKREALGGAHRQVCDFLRLPPKPELVMLTNVVPSERAVNTHSMSVGPPYADHSTRILLFGSSALTVASTEKAYISRSQRTDLPTSSLALPRLNQSLDVIVGPTNASNTLLTGLRISISALATILRPSCCLLRFVRGYVSTPVFVLLERDTQTD
jgi:hypothetical protein